MNNDNAVYCVYGVDRCDPDFDLPKVLLGIYSSKAFAATAIQVHVGDSSKCHYDAYEIFERELDLPM